MKTVTCLIGTLSFDDLIYKKGETIETSDEMAEHLLKHRLVIEYIPTPEPEPEDPIEFPEDISLMNITTVLEYLDTVKDLTVLEGLLEAEKTGKNRKTVTEALETKLEA